MREVVVEALDAVCTLTGHSAHFTAIAARGHHCAHASILPECIAEVRQIHRALRELVDIINEEQHWLPAGECERFRGWLPVGPGPYEGETIHAARKFEHSASRAIGRRTGQSDTPALAEFLHNIVFAQ